MSKAPYPKTPKELFYTTWQTPMGPLVGVASNSHLYLLEFASRKELQMRLQQIARKEQGVLKQKASLPLQHIKEEIAAYFSHKLTSFKTPFVFGGTPFQKKVHRYLTTIPYGTTQSYKEVAQAINHPNAVRAVANAHGANPLAIIVPCHRVIRSSGELGGYAGEVAIKKDLLNLERGKNACTPLF